MTEDENKIKVFGSDDDLKSLGELLSNETSRKIIKNLMEHQMYTNEIATKLDMRVSLVIHHLKKMEALGLLEITDKKIKRKGEKHRFFTMNSDIFVTLDHTKEDLDKKGKLKRIFRDGMKFASIGIAAILTFVTKINMVDPKKFQSITTVEHNNSDSLIYALLVVIIGLFIMYLLKKNR